jgi:glycosyltransferase involved in cell wall biosynthesis
MGILFVANTSFFLRNFMLGTMKRVREEGCEVVAAAPVDELTPRIVAEGFPVHPVRELDRKGANPLQDIRLVRELYALYRREKPDLVLHFTIKLNVFGGIAARLAGVPSIPTITGLGWLFTDRSAKALLGAQGYKLLYRFALGPCPQVVFLNRDDRAFFVKSRLAREARCIVIPGSGVNTDRFAPPGTAINRGEHGCCVFLLIGRLLWDKGIAEYADAARIVKKTYPDAEFRLLGPFDRENRAAVPESAVRGWEAEGAITYLGRTDDVRPFVEESDVVVLPSYREGLPSVLLEAMSMARPVIASDVPGCRDLVEEGRTGFLVPAQDAGTLADRMITCIGMGPGGRGKMGMKARERVLREFDARKAEGAYASLVNGALDRKTRAR